MCFLAVFSLVFALSYLWTNILPLHTFERKIRALLGVFVFVCKNRGKNTRIWVWGGVPKFLVDGFMVDTQFYFLVKRI